MLNKCSFCLVYCTRYLINPDQSLQIHYVTLQDAGKYTCTAVNDVGESKASAQLFVDGIKISTHHNSYSFCMMVLFM